MSFLEESKRIVRANPVLKKTAKAILKPVLDKEDREFNKAYRRWLNHNAPTPKELAAQKKESKLLSYQPLISILIPTYNTNPIFLEKTIKSVLEQTYSNWELIIVDDASTNDTVRSIIKDYAILDNRIKYKFLDTNHHIAGATNKAIEMSSGDFITLFDHDDIMWPNAVYEIVKALNEKRDLEFIYTDEDRIVGDSDIHVQPFFKPSWNQDFLWSINYITHLTTIKKSILDRYKLNGEYNGSQDWELFLRITRNISKDRIYHIPKIVYSWRVHEGSTALALEVKPYVAEAQKKTLYSDLKQRECKNFELSRDELYLAQWKLQFLPTDRPKISLVFCGVSPSRKTISKLREKTDYPDYEICIFDRNITYREILATITGEYVVIINKNIKPNTPQWLTHMLGDASRADIGCVLAYVDPMTVIKNLEPILDPNAIDFLKLPFTRFIGRNFYLTCKYDIGEFCGSVVMTSSEKLRQTGLDSSQVELPELSSNMVKQGLVNLYNPHIRC